MLVQFLREHRSEWADFNVDAYTAASLKAGTYAYPGMRPTRFTGSQIIMPLGHMIEHEEVYDLQIQYVFYFPLKCCLLLIRSINYANVVCIFHVSDTRSY